MQSNVLLKSHSVIDSDSDDSKAVCTLQTSSDTAVTTLTVPTLRYVKLYQTIRTDDDFRLLQALLHQLSNWCDSNLMEINPSKSKHITFHRTKSPIAKDLYLGGDLIERCNIVRDLGVYMDSSLNFSTVLTLMVFV